MGGFYFTNKRYFNQGSSLLPTELAASDRRRSAPPNIQMVKKVKKKKKTKLTNSQQIKAKGNKGNINSINLNLGGGMGGGGRGGATQFSSNTNVRGQDTNYDGLIKAISNIRQNDKDTRRSPALTDAQLKNLQNIKDQIRLPPPQIRLPPPKPDPPPAQPQPQPAKLAFLGQPAPFQFRVTPPRSPMDVDDQVKPPPPKRQEPTPMPIDKAQPFRFTYTPPIQPLPPPGPKPLPLPPPKLAPGLTEKPIEEPIQPKPTPKPPKTTTPLEPPTTTPLITERQFDAALLQAIREEKPRVRFQEQPAAPPPQPVQPRNQGSKAVAAIARIAAAAPPPAAPAPVAPVLVAPAPVAPAPPSSYSEWLRTHPEPIDDGTYLGGSFDLELNNWTIASRKARREDPSLVAKAAQDAQDAQDDGSVVASAGESIDEKNDRLKRDQGVESLDSDDDDDSAPAPAPPPPAAAPAAAADLAPATAPFPKLADSSFGKSVGKSRQINQQLVSVLDEIASSPPPVPFRPPRQAAPSPQVQPILEEPLSRQDMEVEKSLISLASNSGLRKRTQEFAKQLATTLAGPPKRPAFLTDIESSRRNSKQANTTAASRREPPQQPQVLPSPVVSSNNRGQKNSLSDRPDNLLEVHALAKRARVSPAEVANALSNPEPPLTVRQKAQAFENNHKRKKPEDTSNKRELLLLADKPATNKRGTIGGIYEGKYEYEKGARLEVQAKAVAKLQNETTLEQLDQLAADGKQDSKDLAELEVFGPEVQFGTGFVGSDEDDDLANL